MFQIKKKQTHIIAAYASYHGDLNKGEYQFTFGGSSVKSNKKHDVYNGFLMSQSGYIKRFVLQDFGIKIQSDIPKYVHRNVAINLISTQIPLFYSCCA